LKVRTCGPADRPTGKLRTWSAGLVRSLRVGRSASPHFTRAQPRTICYESA